MLLEVGTAIVVSRNVISQCLNVAFRHQHLASSRFMSRHVTIPVKHKWVSKKWKRRWKVSQVNTSMNMKVYVDRGLHVVLECRKAQSKGE